MTRPIALHPKDFLNNLTGRKTTTPVPEAAEQLTRFAKRIEHMANSGGGVSTFDIERLILKNDLLPVNYLDRGRQAADTVCRIVIPELGGFENGTGFLVSPNLLITNNHVISNITQARRAVVEFGFEVDNTGIPRQGKRFRLKPDAGFVTDTGLDFTLVAVEETSEDGTTTLSEFGFVRLMPETGKVNEGEFVTVIQHPNGREKQIAIRENKVLQIGTEDGDAPRDNFLWYASDTAQGSSGSPVFNDNWQVVALHHKGVPDRNTEGKILLTNGRPPVNENEINRYNDEDVVWIANQGVRVSKIVEKIKNEAKATQTENIITTAILAFVDDAYDVRSFPGTLPHESIVRTTNRTLNTLATESTFTFTEGRQKKVRPESFYNNREGYKENFLKTNIPLPTVTNKAIQRFGNVATLVNSNETELKYTHFSVVFNGDRKLAYYTATNIDGSTWQKLSRGKDSWYYDPRVSLDLQIGDELYGNEPGGNYFDRGHLCRRLDPVWGDSRTAGTANDDTFHWTNCSPQYYGFNQGEELWQGLENYILYNTNDEDVLATVFTGPVFDESDPVHRGVGIPKKFWKLVAVQDNEGRLYTSAYVVDQSIYVTNIPFEELPVSDFNNFQVPIKLLSETIGIDFGPEVLRADQYSRNAPEQGQGIRGFAEISHTRRGKSKVALEKVSAGATEILTETN